MPDSGPPDYSSTVIAALLVLALVFAGYWIVAYVQGGNPWAMAPWFGVAAVIIVGVGIFVYLRRGSDNGGR